MFQEGNILYFKPFYFKNGNTAKPKYFIVLKNVSNETLLASLPSSKDYIPKEHEFKLGCLELEDFAFNCFVFAPQSPITVCNKSFNFKTYVYGSQLDMYEIEKLKEIYPNEGIDYELWGKMKPEILNKLILCLKTSKIVKNKYRRIL